MGHFIAIVTRNEPSIATSPLFQTRNLVKISYQPKLEEICVTKMNTSYVNVNNLYCCGNKMTSISFLVGHPWNVWLGARDRVRLHCVRGPAYGEMHSGQASLEHPIRDIHRLPTHCKSLKPQYVDIDWPRLIWEMTLRESGIYTFPCLFRYLGWWYALLWSIRKASVFLMLISIFNLFTITVNRSVISQSSFCL